MEDRQKANALSPQEKRRAQVVIDAQMSALDERIDRAKVVVPKTNPSTVQFGQWVQYKPLQAKDSFQLQIVGVDEANLRVNKVSFLAPVIQAMMGKSVGDTVEVRLGDASREFVIEKVW